MRKWLRRSFTWLSLLLLFLSAGIWVRSYFKADEITWSRQVSDLKSARCGGAVYAGAVIMQSWSADYTITAQPPMILVGYFPPREYFVDLAKVESGFRWKSHAHPDVAPSWRAKLAQLVRFESGREETAAQQGQSPAMHQRFIIFSIWPITLASAILPALSALRWRRRRTRTRRGLCIHCGYDLRGGGDVCSECGAPRPVAVK
jgi:hypothetical protein